MDFNITTGLLVALLIAVLEVIKKVEFVDHKFIPIRSLGLGILIGIFYSGFDIKEGILYGVMLGVSAVGLYSGATNVVEGFKARE